jgi:hypothetical protein
MTISFAFAASSASTPSKDAHIVKFFSDKKDADGHETGPLHIIYSDGSDVEIQNETKRFGDGQNLPQNIFSNIQLAGDQQHIGWLAEYMICSQSYPCPVELVIFRAGKEPTRIGPQYGIFWNWKFLKGGKRIASHSGFPHGDNDGAYALHDTETGRELAKYRPEQKNAPNWVKELEKK